VDDPDALAAFEHEARCVLALREAETLADDLARFDRYGTASRFRVTTTAERLLLEASGLKVPTTEAVFTKVEWLGPDLRMRTWRRQPVVALDLTRG